MRRISMQNVEHFLPTKRSHKNNIIILSLLFFIYFLENSSLPQYIGSSIFLYVIKPILWIGVILIIRNFRQFKYKGKIRSKKLIIEWSIIFGIIYVCTNVFAGFIYGLGKSSYSHTLSGILMNIIYVGSALYGRELIRNYLVNSYTKKENYMVFILIAILMTLTSFNMSRYLKLKDLETLVKFFAEFFAPEFSNNIFASYLVYLGGPVPSIVYFGIIQAFHWISPILPNLQWIVTALIGILSPIFFLMSIQSIYLNATKQINKREQGEEGIVSWIITSIISIGIIWFAVGVFPIYPSVVATGSMEPTIKPGDMILVKKISNMDEINTLKVGDIILFKRGNILISHRIIEILDTDEEGVQFKTKGDKNSGPDTDLVKSADVKGLVKYVIPKIGLPTLFIKDENDIPIDEILF